MTSTAPAPLPCASCEGEPIDHDAGVRCEDCTRTPGAIACVYCFDAPATGHDINGRPRCEGCADEIAAAAAALLADVRTPTTPSPQALANVAVVRILAAARLWLPAARIEIKLAASVRLARAGVRRFPRAANDARVMP